MRRNVIAIIDGAAGSCGKGKVIGELATMNNVIAAVTNNMPNAGHIYVGDKEYVFRNIPVSIVNPNTQLFIGPGSVIDLDDFITEYDSIEHLLNGRKIYVHELVPVIDKRHKEHEKEIIKSGSTFKGSGAALSEKIMRDNRLEFFKGHKNAVVINTDEYLKRVYECLNNPFGYVILEGAQGCDLSLNHSGNYPYTTSRNVSSSQLLADSGIAPTRLLDTIMVIRPFPIRISNISHNGEYMNTGSYGTGAELTWSHINVSSHLGTYPTIDMFDYLYQETNDEYIEFLIGIASKDDLIQVFGPTLKKDLSVVKLLELERLFNKRNGRKKYDSLILGFQITDLSELTTVTRKERRIFDLDIVKLKNNCLVNEPTFLYLNFFQQLNESYKNIEGNYKEIYFDRYIREYLNFLEDETNTKILALGTGAKNGQRILMCDRLK